MIKNLLLLTAIILTFPTNKLNGQSPTPLKKGDQAYNFTATDDKGNEIDLESLKGKIVLLNFTATFCGPCWDTYGQMDELQKKYGDQLKIISIHMDQEKEKWKKLAKKKNITFDVASVWESDQKNDLYEMYEANGFPYFVLIDQNGVVRKKWFGNYEKRLRKNIKKAIARLEK